MKAPILAELERRFGKARRVEKSQSLYRFATDDVLIYFRYSKVHNGNTLFYGLRSEDLRQLEGRRAVICFLWDGQAEPTFLPFSEYEEIFRSATPARDGQFKVHIRIGPDGFDLSLPKVGRFSLDPYIGWGALDSALPSQSERNLPPMSHTQIQLWLTAIGTFKNYEVWIPLADRPKVRALEMGRQPLLQTFPSGFEQVQGVLSQVDVLWLERGSNRLGALFEVEHSTTIYSGLLRLNDVRLVVPNMEPTFSIVADDERRSSFLRQVNRPTFQRSGLSEICRFMKYEDIFSWHSRTTNVLTCNKS